MPLTRFGHVFGVLMLLGTVTALLAPASLGRGLRGNIEVLFAPVARPVQALAHWTRLRTAPPSLLGLENSPMRSAESLLEENQRLRIAVASLTAQLEELRRINALRDQLGEPGRHARFVRVIGASADDRDVLILQAATTDGLSVGQTALYSDGVAGRIIDAGLGGARLRLISDRGCRVNGQFGRFTRSAAGDMEFVKLNTPAPLVEGRGRGALVVSNLAFKDIASAQLVPGDWVVLRDADGWPQMVQGYLLGRIEKIETQRQTPLFAEIHIRPPADLLSLREVMVLPARPVPEAR